MRSTFLRIFTIVLLGPGVLACGGDGSSEVAPITPATPTDTGPTDTVGRDTVPIDTTPENVVPDSAGHLNTGTFFSPALGTSKSYRIYFPPTYTPSKTRRYSVVYFLHGFNGDERYWTDSLRIDKVADSLAKVSGVELLIVMPDGDNSSYHTWVNPPTYQSCLDRGVIDGEPVATFCVPSMRYDDYIAVDLVKHIDTTYRTLASPQRRGIAGYSLGGGGAVFLTLAYPSTFGAVASFSGGLFTLLNVGTPTNPIIATDTVQLRNYWGFMWVDFNMAQQYGGDLSRWRTYDPMTIIQSRPASSIPPMWFVVGSDENVLVRTTNELFHNVLTQRGVAHEYTDVLRGEHNATFWRAQAGNALAWLGSRLKP